MFTHIRNLLSRHFLCTAPTEEQDSQTSQTRRQLSIRRSSSQRANTDVLEQRDLHKANFQKKETPRPVLKKNHSSYQSTGSNSRPKLQKEHSSYRSNRSEPERHLPPLQLSTTGFDTETIVPTHPSP